VLFRVNKLLSITFLLFAASAANASLTVTHQDAILTTGLCAADTSAPISHTFSNVIGPINAILTNLGREFIQPPASLAGLSNEQDNPVKPLPAVPTALLMVLTGFICVSLARDRRIYLAALAGLLWLGQAGIQAVPQLALRISHRNHTEQQFSAELSCTYYLENSNRLRNDIEGTQYVGLLHHLAGIPDSPASFLRMRKQESRKLTTQLCFRPNLSKNTNPFQPQSAFLSEQYNLNSLFKCSVLRARHSIRFSPPFIFEIIPRGPPKLA